MRIQKREICETLMVIWQIVTKSVTFTSNITITFRQRVSLGGKLGQKSEYNWWFEKV